VGRPAIADVVAGASVALVLIPQSMAYAGVAGLPAERGLLAAMLAPLAGAVFASSRYLQTGPTAITSLLALGALLAVAAPGAASLPGLAAVLAIMVGLIRVAIGLLRLGSIAYLMSPTVVAGFTSAAALLIMSSQVPAALGVPGGPGNPIVVALGVLADPARWSPAAIAVTAGVMALVLGARRVTPLLPGALVGLLGAAAIARFAGYPAAMVGTMRLEAGFALDVAPETMVGLALPALVIAVVGFAEPAAIARRYAAADREPWNPDREFIGQGAANLAAGLSGGFPVGGSFSRTAVARLAGARSRWASVTTSLIVIALLPFIWLLETLPVAALAGVVIAAVVSLVDPAGLLVYRRASRAQFGVALATFAATLAFAPHVEYGIVVGVIAAVGVHLWRENKVYAATWIDGPDLHLRPHGVLYFVSVPQLEVQAIRYLSQHPDVRRIVVHLDGLGRMDVSGAMTMREMLLDARDAGLEVEVRDVPPQSVRIVAQVLRDVAPITTVGQPDRP
jgi:SulP family sulfate permease